MDIHDWMHWRLTEAAEKAELLERERTERVRVWIESHAITQITPPSATYTGADARFLRDLGISPR